MATVLSDGFSPHELISESRSIANLAPGSATPCDSCSYGPSARFGRRRNRLASYNPFAALVDHDRQIRAEERCRIGRELHDSTAQLLVALQLQTLYAKEMLDEPQCRAALVQIEQTLHELHRQVRCIAFLNDAPVLRRGMLPQALSSMVLKFERLSGLRINLAVDPGYVPQSEAIACAVYRIAQEALANVHRHAHADTVEVRLRSTAEKIRLVVTDNGVGVSPARLRSSRNCGLGLKNMRARVRDFGGRLSIRNRSAGIRLIVSIPA